MAIQVLLKQDIDSLGRKGDIVAVKPGHARNLLFPTGAAIIADAKALREQVKLKKERDEQTILDKKDSEEIASRIEGITLLKIVKVDHEGHMYGSVTPADVMHLLQDETKVELEKRSLQIKPFKTTGVHVITVKLKEEVTATFNLKIISEENHRAESEEKPA